jgi:hypothetical protein
MKRLEISARLISSAGSLSAEKMKKEEVARETTSLD